jgi:hypothetical protein
MLTAGGRYDIPSPTKPLRKSEYALPRFFQRAADGGIAAETAERNGLLRASRNEGILQSM